MKKTIFGLLSAIACMCLFSSCEDRYEVYQMNVDYTHLTSDGDHLTPTSAYFILLDWQKSEQEDSDKVSEKKAFEENDREARQEFEEEFMKYNEGALYARYMQAGLNSVSGEITYTLTRMDNGYRKGEVMEVKRISVNFKR